MMQYLQQLDPLTIGLAAIGLSLLVNLLALGALLGRGDRKTLDLIAKVRRNQRRDSRRLQESQLQIGQRLQEEIQDLRVHVKKLEKRQDSLAASRLKETSGPVQGGSRRSSSRRYNSIDKKHHIYTLARRGVPAQDISRRLNVYQGETDLVLGLKQFLGTQAAAAASACESGQELPN
ncbi:MAG TPA: hypothetical protein VLU25_04390 [Acidobacteriota bacterium]|nr:hypothetical protein [Acidobacteriota bacterium]